MQNNYNAQSYSHTAAPSKVQSQLLEIFMDLNQYEENIKDKAKAQRKLAARRAIEQHFEKRQLERELEDYWAD